MDDMEQKFPNFISPTIQYDTIQYTLLYGDHKGISYVLNEIIY